MFDDLPDRELLDVLEGSPQSAAARKLFAERDAPYSVLKDEAFGEYWRRQLRTRQLTPESLKKLLASKFESAKSVIGDEIIFSEIDPELLETVISGSEKDGWLYRQAASRKLIVQILQGCNRRALEEILSFRAIWAIEKVVEQLVLQEDWEDLIRASPLTRKQSNRLKDKCGAFLRSQQK